MNKRQKKKFVKKYERKTWKNKKKVDKFFDRWSDVNFKEAYNPLAAIVADSAGIPTELLDDPPNPVKHYKYQTPAPNSSTGNRVNVANLIREQTDRRRDFQIVKLIPIIMTNDFLYHI